MYRIYLLWLLLVNAINFSQAGKEDGEIVYPVQIGVQNDVQKAFKRDSLAEEKEHEDAMTVKINSKRGDIIIDLKKNKNLYPGNMVLRTYGSDGKAKHDNIQPTNCHYDGTVRDREDSYAFISTCRGLIGSIDTGEKRYDLEPSGSDGAHLLYPVEDVLKELWEKLSHDSPIHKVDKKAAIPNMNGTKKLDIPTSDDTKFNAGFKFTTAPEAAKKTRKVWMEGVEEVYKPYMTVDYPRYVEMFISVGDEVVDKYEKDNNLIIERVLNSMGQVNKVYQAINIWISVVGMEIQNNGPSFQRTKGPDYAKDADFFNEHISKIRTESGLQDIRIDNAQLLRDRGDVDGITLGEAFFGSMCAQPDSVAVNKWNYESISGNSYVMSHEIGHNLNFDHDDEHCKCLSSRGCFMPPTVQKTVSRPGFSDCNMRDLGKKIFPCLNDFPKNTITSQCGNGLLEKDEECDCGTPESCRKVDPCCQPKGCKLKPTSQCSPLQKKCCTKQCQFQRQGVMCRPIISNCDQPEYCTGESDICPTDKYAANGLPCGESKTMIKGILGDDGTVPVTRELTPRVEGRYFKIIPRLWKKKERACMQLEMHGCGTGEDSASVTTTISTPLLIKKEPYQVLCLAPAVDKCEDVQDGTKLRFKPASDMFGCTADTMKFDYTAEGTLMHHCSKKKVCKAGDGDNSWDDIALILSSKCKDESTKFDRTSGWAMKHRKSGLCMSTKYGYSTKNVDVVVASWGCEKEKKNKLFLQNIDCAKPMGITNGEIPTSSMKSGEYKSDHWVDKIRMSEFWPWCAQSKSDGSWFQVDMGKRVEIRYISMKGNIYDHVTGFNLMYSNDGKAWKYYQESGMESMAPNSHCYQGVCAPTLNHQCRKIWGAGAKSANDVCWKGLNDGKEGYGTCSPIEVKACAPSDVKCGQLQCTSSREKPYYEQDYGKEYFLKTIAGHKCSAAKIVGANDEIGLGMVEEGSKCGEGKICHHRKCTAIPDMGCQVDQKMCNGKGVCLNDGTCLCEGGYDPETKCVELMKPVDGGWTDWSEWGECNKACGGGKSKRRRYCTNPAPKYGGEECKGDHIEEEDCNQEECPVGSSCKIIQSALKRRGKNPLDGVYTINLKPQNLEVYCDMTRDGGGWTLLVSSHTNTWSADNVKLRNKDAPELTKDYSILEYGNAIKDSYIVTDGKFQFRLEANNPGEWGGIWEAPTSYDVASANDNQIDKVELKKKFNKWEYNSNGLERRVPYIDGGVRITMGKKNSHWGCITDNEPKYHPVRWMGGAQRLEFPSRVWYWIREGELVYPKTCLELYFRDLQTTRNPLPSGVYKIEPAEGNVVETYCEMERYGGGWTLLVNSAGSGWQGENVKMRNEKDASSDEYSIFGMLESIVEVERGEISYNIMIEADGEGENGGIFEIPLAGDGKTNSALKPSLARKFGDWDDKKENIGQFQISFNDGQLAASDDKSATSGVIISEKGGEYMSTLEKPSNIKVWLREGGSRQSCNDVRVNSDQSKDGFYMLKNNLPVYCDMTTTPGEGWTLIVTAATKGWTKEQAKSRNQNRPSMHNDYSILSVADSIKSLSKASHFKYMLTAHTHPNWGGIWRAPMEYSFVSTENTNSDVELLHQFGKWSYDQWSTPNLGPARRMPYLQETWTAGSAILTTARKPTVRDSDTVWEFGTILSTGSTPPNDKPSQWINEGEQSPGFIWYWMNENKSAGTVNRKTTLLREKGNCWNKCKMGGKERESGGTCKMCGTNGHCCRKGYPDCIKRLQDAADSDHHMCVKDEPIPNEAQ